MDFCLAWDGTFYQRIDVLEAQCDTAAVCTDGSVVWRIAIPMEYLSKGRGY